jgi:hypothetical protein
MPEYVRCSEYGLIFNHSTGDGMLTGVYALTLVTYIRVASKRYKITVNLYALTSSGGCLYFRFDTGDK